MIFSGMLWDEGRELLGRKGRGLGGLQNNKHHTVMLGALNGIWLESVSLLLELVFYSLEVN